MDVSFGGVFSYFIWGVLLGYMYASNGFYVRSTTFLINSCIMFLPVMVMVQKNGGPSVYTIFISGGTTMCVGSPGWSGMI